MTKRFHKIKGPAAKLLSVVLAGAMTCAFSPAAAFAPQEALAAETVSGKIVVDGNADDWDADLIQDSDMDCNFGGWAACKDENNLYFVAFGSTGYEWMLNNSKATIKTANTEYAVTPNPYNSSITDNQGGTVKGSLAVKGQNKDGYVFEASIPLSYFDGNPISVSFKESVLPLNDDDKENAPDVYEGISIDGKFLDWAPVTKKEVNCPNSQHPNCIKEVATVFDGDYVYVYIKEGSNNSATGAGTHTEGIYALTTDLGRTLMFQLKAEGTEDSVSSPANITFSHKKRQWEICIPKADLPAYSKTISFGLYLCEPFIKDIANLREEQPSGSFVGVSYDGHYEDWKYYPHHLIQYTTAGTHDVIPDGEAALYVKDTTLFGHVETSLQKHVSGGSEITQSVQISFRDPSTLKADSGDFYPRFYTVDGNGKLHTVNAGTHFEQGTTEVVVGCLGVSADNKTLEEASEMNAIFGRMYVTAGANKDEAEFKLDLEAVAKYLNKDVSDFKNISIRWGRIGDEWVTTAGTSTAPFVGIALCIGAVAGVYAWRRKKQQPAVATAGSGASKGE